MKKTATWFEDALQPEVVVDHLSRELPELAGAAELAGATGVAGATGASRLTGCRITRVRSVLPEGSWTALYEFHVDRGDGSPLRTVVATGTLTPPDLPLPPSPLAGEVPPIGEEGWRCVLPELRLALAVPPLDESIPGLAMLLDPEQGPELISRVLHPGGPPGEGAVVTACAPIVATHKPGVRATVICHLGYADGGHSGPAAVVVKVHSDEQGKRGHEALLSFHESPLGQSQLVRIPRPLGYLPDLHLSVQEYIEYDCLKDLFHTVFEGGSPASGSQLVGGIRAAGAGLAALHCCGSRHGSTQTWEDDLAGLRGKHARLASVVPELSGPVAEALERITAAAVATPAAALGPSHGSFHPAEVLVSGADVAFIDFDKSCQAEPGRDLASFTTKLRHMAVNKVDSHRYDPRADGELIVEGMRAMFLDAYRDLAPLSDHRLAVWEGFELLSLVLSASKKMHGPRTENCLRMLERHLELNDI